MTNTCRTYSVEDACQAIGCQSLEWFLERVRSGVFPARRIVRELRFTDADIDAILDACANQPRQADADDVPQPTERSRRKRSR